MDGKLSWMCTELDCERPKVGRLDVCMSHHQATEKEKRVASQPQKPLTPLRRSGKPKPVSEKRADQKARYNKRVKEWLVGKMCAVYPHLKATQCHHRNGRENEMLEDETYWLAVSQDGHDYIHANSEWSREKGFMLLRSVTNKPTI